MEDLPAWEEGVSTPIVTRSHLSSKRSNLAHPRRRLPRERLTIGFHLPNIAMEVSNHFTRFRIFSSRKSKFLSLLMWRARMIRVHSRSWLYRTPPIMVLWAPVLESEINHRYFSRKMGTSSRQKRPKWRGKLSVQDHALQRYLNLSECRRSHLRNRRWTSSVHQVNAHLWHPQPLAPGNQEEPAPIEAQVRSQSQDWATISRSLGNWGHQNFRRVYRATCTHLCPNCRNKRRKMPVNPKRECCLPKLRRHQETYPRWPDKISGSTPRTSMRRIGWSKNVRSNKL